MKELEQSYRRRYERLLIPTATRLEGFLRDCLSAELRIDRITARAKAVDRFIEKAQRQVNGAPKYNDPLNQIQDQVGARIVTYYADDVPCVANAAETYLRHIESRILAPESEFEFGYFGKHYIMLFPVDVVPDPGPDLPPFFELQIATLFQHAWSEANHDLGYKPGHVLTSEQKRKLAFTAAQAWGADLIFNELHAQARSAGAVVQADLPITEAATEN